MVSPIREGERGHPVPEGHSVHRIAARFRSAMVGRAVQATSPQGRFSRGAALLDGHEMEECFAVGKQMFARFGTDLHLRVHLGIYGAWDFSSREAEEDRKSTRLNSSHVAISYAVFCLKKKTV